MANVFASDVQKQFFKTGLQENLRDSLPFGLVSEIDTENAEYIVNRYGTDVSSQSTPNSIYRRATGFTYSRDKKSIDEIATVTDEILYQELMREGFDIVADRQDKHMHALKEAIHRHTIDTARLGAGSVLDNEVLAGSASALTPITLSASNPDDVVATVVQILQENHAYGDGSPFVMLTPAQAKWFNLFAMGAGFSYADAAVKDSIFVQNGGRVIRAAQGFGGLDVIVTNELPRTQVVTFTGNPLTTETLTINGVVYQVIATPAAAGDVDLGADAEGTIDNLVAAINNSEYALAGVASGTGAYYELSQANRTTFDSAGVKARKISATQLEIRGFVDLTVTDTLTNATVDNSGAQVVHALAGAYNSVSSCLPSKGMRVDEKPLAAIGGTGVHGYELTTFQMHDAVVWTNKSPKLINIYTA